MSSLTVLGIGATVYATKEKKDAARDATNAQVKSTGQAVEEQRRQFDKLQEILKPYMGAGGQGLSSLMGLMGLGGQVNPDRFFEQLKGTPMEGHLPGLQEGYLNAVREGDGDVDAGIAFLNRAVANTGDTDLISAFQQAPQQQQIDDIRNGPEFNAINQVGEEAILANASATGGLRGGNTQTALARFRQQNLSDLINKQMSRFGGLASLGQNSAAGVGSAGMDMGNNVSKLFVNQGEAIGSGAIARGNANAGMWGDFAGMIGKWQGMRTPPINGDPSQRPTVNKF